jgi:phage/plasmid-associated DNA primase
VKIEQSDRRFVVTECSNRHIQDKVFFGKVNDEWNDPLAVRGFYDFLMKQDISDFEPSRDRVITDTYKDIKSVSVPTIARWLEHKYYTYNNQLESSNPTWASLLKHCQATELFKSYKKWMEKSGYKTEGVNTTRFGRDIKKYKGVELKRTNKGVIYDLCYEEIFTGLVERGYIEEITETFDNEIEKEEDYYSEKESEYDSD